MNTAIYYGSTTGNTEYVAELIQQHFGGASGARLFNVASANPSTMLDYDLLIWGSPTWGEGELQDDWLAFQEELDLMDLSHKVVAIFGLGDQLGYPTEFVDAIRLLHDKALELGAEVIGQWPDYGYEYMDSKAVCDGLFCGLAIDEDNQPDLTQERVAHWCAQLRNDLAALL